MYRAANGEEIFVIDSHMAYWDASPANIKNKYGQGFIDCMYDYHKALSPAEEIWPKEQYVKNPEDLLLKDIFVDGYADMAIFQPVYLKEFYHTGFGSVERNAVLKGRNPDRFVMNGSFDPRYGEPGLEWLQQAKEEHDIQGIKLYTAEWHGDSKGYKLTDPWAQRYLAKCQELGVKNIHIHKGPTLYPFNRDAFDVHDVDDAATSFPELNFIVEHCGLPRLEDFCWIGTQEKNVYAGLSVVMAFLAPRPRYFAEVMSELLWWLGPDKLTFSSDYPLWKPGWIIDKFMAFEMPEDLVKNTGVDLTFETKKKILGENVARLYGIDIAAQKAKLQQSPINWPSSEAAD